MGFGAGRAGLATAIRETGCTHSTDESEWPHALRYDLPGSMSTLLGQARRLTQVTSPSGAYAPRSRCCSRPCAPGLQRRGEGKDGREPSRLVAVEARGGCAEVIFGRGFSAHEFPGPIRRCSEDRNRERGACPGCGQQGATRVYSNALRTGLRWVVKYKFFTSCCVMPEAPRVTARAWRLSSITFCTAIQSMP